MARRRHTMAFLQRVAFCKRAWSEALPQIALPRRSRGGRAVQLIGERPLCGASSSITVRVTYPIAVNSSSTTIAAANVSQRQYMPLRKSPFFWVSTL